MTSISFDEFKSYFEFALKVVGLGSAIGATIYKLDVMKSIWRVARGRANSADQNVALEGIRGAGAVGEIF